MSKKVAIINYQCCQPELCENGICKAVQICQRKLLKQEEPFEMPDPYPNMCIGCAICVQACPRGAVEMV